jgi:hypothetical protein
VSPPDDERRPGVGTGATSQSTAGTDLKLTRTIALGADGWTVLTDSDPVPASGALVVDAEGRVIRAVEAAPSVNRRTPTDRDATPIGSRRSPLQIRQFADIAAEVDARGPRRWLIRGIWPAGDYGVHGAEPKAGKTWTVLDLAVSVASGTPWLGAVQIDTPGPVIVFAGEGGAGNIVRRLRAIARARGVTADNLRIWVCTRAPHLSDDEELAELERQIREHRPVLVVVDPLYLAIRGANGADLYAMGTALVRPQRVCLDTGTALLVVTHYNRSRDAKGSARFTGAGPAEWGRVLIAASVLSRHTDPDTKATTVLCELDITGGEIPDQTLRIRRTISSADPDNLDSPLEYSVDVPDADDPQLMPPGTEIAPAAAKLLAAVRAQDMPASVQTLVGWIAAQFGHGLRRETVSRELNALRERGLVDCLDQGVGKARLWLVPFAESAPE